MWQPGLGEKNLKNHGHHFLPYMKNPVEIESDKLIFKDAKLDDFDSYDLMI